MSDHISGRRTEPAGFLVLVDAVTRIHFLDWGAPPEGVSRPGVVLIHGLAATGWTWTPVARKLAAELHVVAPDLRGHGLSDAPVDGYSLEGLADDVLAVAEGAGFLDATGARLVLAGHGFGALVAATLARTLAERCAGLVLVDGGWEQIGGSAGTDPDELLRALEEPPEVLRSMTAYLADRAAFDPATWDAEQERAARAAVVELPAGRVVPVARPHVLAGCVAAMVAYDPGMTLPAVLAPMAALVAADDEAGSRRKALARAQEQIAAAGRPVIRLHDFPADGHNLMRYRADAVATVIATLAGGPALSAPRAYHPGS